ncbi:MAG: hypothetical protein LBN12_03190 [Clostridiales Family XIII bacterium]|nr:hypothetical protein [Clostridiales Family XIII bacterium]
MKAISAKTVIIIMFAVLLLAAGTLHSVAEGSGSRAYARDDNGGARDDNGGARDDGGGGSFGSKEEVVYASLGADGKAKEAYVVNILDVQKAGRVEDRGAYTSVKNLTTEEAITLADGKVTATAPAGDFYYQGNIAAPKLPWFFEITYMLDGRAVDPAALGGQSGRLVIEIRTIPNAAVDTGWSDNCMIQTQVTLDAAHCRGIEAEGGMIANAGASKLITFTTLPGTEGKMRVSADVVYFSMPGIQFSAVPLQMSIGDIDTAEMTDQLTELTDAIAELDNGVAEMRDGAQKLKDGVADYANGTRIFQDGLVQASSGGAELKAGSQDIEDGLEMLSSGLGEVEDGARKLPKALPGQLGPAVAAGVAQGVSAPLAQGLAQQLQANHLLTDLDGDLVNASGIAAATALISGVLADEQYGLEPVLSQALVPALSDGLSQAFGGTKKNPGLIGGIGKISGGLAALSGKYKTFDDGLGAYTDGVSLAADGAGQLTGGAAQLESGLAEFSDGIADLKTGTAEMRSETAGMADEMKEKIDEMMDEYDKSDYAPLSFAFPDSGTIKAIQFVITCDAIEEPVQPEEAKEEAGKESILDRLLALFSVSSR